MFQIKIHPIALTPDLLITGRKNTLYKRRLGMCNRYKEALMCHISDYFKVDEIDETLFLKFYPTNDKIKKHYSFIKDKKFKAALKHFVEELHHPIGLVF